MLHVGVTANPPSGAVPLRILLVEDSEWDAELLLAELRRGGYEPLWERVCTPGALVQAIKERHWEVITCDWVMPGFDASAALAVLRQCGVDVPIIIVSGEVGEEVAVTAMKGGAHDYVSKHALTRLCPAIARELREAEERRARQRAEVALRASEQNYRDLVETAHDIIWSVDANGCCTFVNRAIRERLGYEPAQVIGQPFATLVTPPQRDKLCNLFRYAKPGETYLGYELELLRKDGMPAAFNANIVVFGDEDGNLVGTRGTLLDITERQRAERALKRSENYLKILFESAPDPVYVHDAKGRVVDCNRAAETLLGYKKNELLGRSVLVMELLDHSSHDRAAALLSASLAQPLGPFELTLKRKDKSQVAVEIRTYPVCIDDAIHVLGIARDVTARM